MIKAFTDIFQYKPINDLLSRYNGIPIVDIQIRRTNGKFRSLPLISLLLETNNLGCFRQRKTYSYLPNIEIFTPRDNILDPTTYFDYYCCLVSQTEEVNQGLISISLTQKPFIALIDKKDFVPKGWDRQLVPFVGYCLNYHVLYRQIMENYEGPRLDSMNLALQYYYQDFLSKTGDNNCQLSELFNIDNPETHNYPWWNWLINWAKMLKYNSWFSKEYNQEIKNSISVWIEDRKEIEKISQRFYYYLDTRFDRNHELLLKELQK